MCEVDLPCYVTVLSDSSFKNRTCAFLRRDKLVHLPLGIKFSLSIVSEAQTINQVKVCLSSLCYSPTLISPSSNYRYCPQFNCLLRILNYIFVFNIVGITVYMLFIDSYFLMICCGHLSIDKYI